jgi:hypothetical protein
LTENGTTGAGTAALAPGPAATCSLSRFELWSGCVTNACACAPCPALACHTRLEVLVLVTTRPHLPGEDDGRLSGGAVPEVGAALAQLRALTRLDLRRASLGDVGVRALLPSLAPLSRLQDVILSRCAITPLCQRALSRRLRACAWVRPGRGEPFLPRPDDCLPA